MSWYGYIRVSDERQARSGLGLQAQRQRILDYVRLRAPKAQVNIFADEAVSASRNVLLAREQGRLLDARLQRGDQLVIAKLDRAFRNLRDFAAQMANWKQRGIVVHLLDIGMDTSTPVGELTASIMAAVAQFESARIGERIRDAMRVAKSQQRRYTGLPPMGWRHRRGKLVPDEHDRRIMARIARLRKRGLLWREIAAKLASQKMRTSTGKAWNKQRCWRGYRVWLAKFSLDMPR